MGSGPSKTRFEEIFRNGKRATGSILKISALPGTGLIGFATSRKIGSHPARNHVRRRMKEALRAQAHCIDSRLDYVVVIGEQGREAALPTMSEEAARLLLDLRARWANELECS